jgi:hypothetical protein
MPRSRDYEDGHRNGTGKAIWKTVRKAAGAAKLSVPDNLGSPSEARAWLLDQVKSMRKKLKKKKRELRELRSSAPQERS